MKRTAGWTQNKTVMKIIALCLAVICWFSVAMADTSVVPISINEVPLNITLQENALAQLGLNIIEIDTQTVTAQVQGDRIAVGQLTPDQLTATIQLASNYTEPGTYDLPIVPAATTTSSVVGIQNKSYKITGYSPSVVKVKLDRIETRSIPVEVEFGGTISLPAGYIRETKELLTPSEINVSGPQIELDKISRCVVTLEGDITLEKNLVSNLAVELRDAEGGVIVPEGHHLKPDNDSVQMVISVLKEKDLPLGVEFLHVPRNFPIENFPYTMSNYEVAVAGPVETVARHKELLLGFVDLTQVGLNSTSFNFDVKLPTGFTNLDNIRTVTVNFDSSGWAEGTFDIEDIRLINAPADYDVELITSQVYNVTMVGDATVLAEMTADDLVAEVDFANKNALSLGQYQQEVRISAPTKGMVWATGEYHIVVQVKEKAS